MGQGIKLAAQLNPEHARAIDDMKDQLLIVLVKKLGGRVMLPVEEIDNTSQDTLTMMLDPNSRVFTFTVGRKQ